MSGLRWITTNRALTSAGTTVKNGGGGAPARSETSPFTMEKALTKDRATPWVSGATPASPFDFDLDFGGISSTSGCAVHGLEVFDARISSIQVYSAAAYFTSPVLQATLTPGSSATPLRDVGATFAGSTHRYWRFRFNFSVVGKLAVSQLVLGALIDLGQWQRDLRKDPFRYVIDGGRSLGLAPIRHDMGRRARRYEIPLNQIIDADNAKLDALVDVVGTFTFFDAEDLVGEAMLPEGRIGQSRPFYALWNDTLPIETLG